MNRQDFTKYFISQQGSKCASCGSTEILEIDHIIPISKGGSSGVENLQVLCHSCNRKKSDTIVPEMGGTRHQDYDHHPSMLRLRIKEVATEKGYSMGKLSRASDVSFNTVKRLWTRPYTGANVDTLNKIAKVLGVTINDLVENVPDD